MQNYYGTDGWFTGDLISQHTADRRNAMWTLWEYNEDRLTTKIDLVHIDSTPTTLNPGEYLLPTQQVHSADGRFHLYYQADGNLVLYQNGVGAIWNINVQISNPGKAQMQSDGNFVVYNSSYQPYWASNTYGYPGARLFMQNDGNVTIRDIYHNPIWATNTCCR